MSPKRVLGERRRPFFHAVSTSGPACCSNLLFLHRASRKPPVRLLAWNVNHRATQKKIPPAVPAAIISLRPDVVVLTEYVDGPTRQSFRDALGAAGLSHQRTSAHVKRQNQVLIASRTVLQEGDIRAPAIGPAMASNALHVHVQAQGIEVLGVRVPDYAKRWPRLKRECWDWIEATAQAVRERPFVILGDFNTDPAYSRARCGPRIGALVAAGWQHAVPATGASFWTRGGHQVRIDHAFASPSIRVARSEYVTTSGDFRFAGREALSDHAALVVDVD